jgi:hypothetical protein
MSRVEADISKINEILGKFLGSDTGTNRAIFRGMAIVIACWVSISLLFCLALLHAAARPRPHAGEPAVARQVPAKAAAPKKAYSASLATSSPAL